MADWTSIRNEIEGTKNKDANRRRKPRRKYTTGVTYSVLATPKGTGILQDISEIGAGLVVDQYLPIGTMVKITFILKKELEEIPIAATAKVVWSVSEEGTHRIGVEFIE